MEMVDQDQMKYSDQNDPKALVKRLNSLSAKQGSKLELDSYVVTLMDAFLIIRDYIAEFEKNFCSSSELEILIERTDLNSWPFFSLSALYKGSQVSNISIGGQTRRLDYVIFLKDVVSNVVRELKITTYSDKEELLKEMQKFFREFVDQIENAISLDSSHHALVREDVDTLDTDVFVKKDKVQSFVQRKDEVCKPENLSNVGQVSKGEEDEDNLDLGDINLFS